MWFCVLFFAFRSGEVSIFSSGLLSATSNWNVAVVLSFSKLCRHGTLTNYRLKGCNSTIKRSWINEVQDPNVYNSPCLCLSAFSDHALQSALVELTHLPAIYSWNLCRRHVSLSTSPVTSQCFLLA